MKINDLFEVIQGPCVAFENFLVPSFYPLLQAIKSRNSTEDAVKFISRSLDRTGTPRETKWKPSYNVTAIKPLLCVVKKQFKRDLSAVVTDFYHHHHHHHHQSSSSVISHHHHHHHHHQSSSSSVFIIFIITFIITSDIRTALLQRRKIANPLGNLALKLHIPEMQRADNSPPAQAHLFA